MRIKRLLISFIFILILPFAVSIVKAQENVSLNDSLTVSVDSLSLKTDSTLIKNDTIKQPPNAIDATVTYESKDSMVMTGTNFIYLFGEGNVKYKNLELKAEYIKVNTDSSVVYATFGIDSIGDEFGYPVFKEGESQYESKTMKYNFKTKKGYITDVITEQGEGYVTAGRTKKMTNDDLFMVDGKYTTCDEHDHPHFYLKLTKAKVRPGKNIVTGPAYLVVEDVPLPLAIPFGYFPFSSKYSSGIIMPTYGDEMARGFCLRDGGYYFAINDYIDLALTGEVYTKGSWGINTRSTYRKRYKYSGNFNLGYLVTILGDKDSPDYSKTNDLSINWSHSQDPKSNPFRTLSASVNFTTSTYDRNQVNSLYSGNYTNNTKSSTINLSQRFPDSPLSLNASASVNQRTKDSTIALNLPNLSIAISELYPFRKKNPVGNPKWYESIRLSYTGTLQNSITTKEDMLFKSNLIKDWRNGMSHNVPISATFNLFKYINITPNVTYNSRWYTTQILQSYDQTYDRLMPSDTVYGFYRVYDYSASIGMNTKIYGFFKPWKMFGDKVQMIRHVMTPSVTFSGAPDFGKSSYGYWKEAKYIDKSGDLETQYYSPFQNGLYGVPGRGRTGTLGFGLDNNLEMKIKSDSDSTGIKKVSLIERLSFNGGYNFLLDSMNWSNLNVSLAIRLTKSYVLNLSGTFDTYTYVQDPKNPNAGIRVNVPRWEAGKGIGRLMGTSFSVPTLTLNTAMIKKLLGKGEKTEDKEKLNNPSNPNEEDNNEADPSNPDGTKAPLRGKKEKLDVDDDGYLLMDIPWNLTLNYNLGVQYNMSKFNPVKNEYDYQWNQGLSLSGDITPTKGWRFNFSTSYDFNYKGFTTLICSLTRNLHCWQMTASIIPIGPYQSYNFTISVSSSLLKDLKYTQSSNSRYNSVNWE